MSRLNENWLPIPGYEDSYEITCDGRVRNKDGHIIKPIESKTGLRVELRQFGQRDRLLVSDLINITWGGCYEDY